MEDRRMQVAVRALARRGHELGRPCCLGRSPRARGLALVEVLVVFFIIAVLMGLLLPTLVASRGQALRVSCASRLRQVHQAVEVWHFDHDDDKDKLPPAQWRSHLMPYVGNRASLFFCPADRNAGRPALLTGAVDAESADRDILLEAGPSVLRKDVAQGTYELWFQETLRARGDYADLRLQVQEQGADKVAITVLSHNPKRRYNLINAATGTVVLSMLGETGGVPTGQSVSLQVGQASYGINVWCNDIHNKSAKVLAIDYCAVVVQPGQDDWKRWLADESATNFARHESRLLNVLWADGSVREASAAEVDPADPAVAARHWLP
jgi:prepilin-type processing-associated H-X9-DG protein